MGLWSCGKADAEPTCPLELIPCSVSTLGQTDKPEVGQRRSIDISDTDNKKRGHCSGECMKVAPVCYLYKLAAHYLCSDPEESVFWSS